MDNILLTQDGDIDLSEGFAQWATESQAVGQHVKIRLNYFQGEFFLDESEGVPYYEYILGKKDLALAKYILQETIEDTPDMVSPLDGILVGFDANTRRMSVSFAGRTVFGEVVMNETI